MYKRLAKVKNVAEMTKTAAGKQSFPVQLRMGTGERFDALIQRRHKSKIDTCSAVIEWFMAQPQLVQTVVLGEVDEGMETDYAHALRRLADSIDGGNSAKLGQSGVVLAVASPPGGKAEVPPRADERSRSAPQK
jgi:hypothetical protein